MGFVDADGIAGDLGGGSLELIDLAGGKLNDAVTLPLGGLRLIDTTGNKLEKAVDVIDEAIAGVPWLKQGQGRSVLCGRRHLARACQAAHGSVELSAARDAGLRDPDEARARFCRNGAPVEETASAVRASRMSPAPAARCCPSARWCWNVCCASCSRAKLCSRFSVSAKA